MFESTKFNLFMMVHIYSFVFLFLYNVFFSPFFATLYLVCMIFISFFFVNGHLLLLLTRGSGDDLPVWPSTCELVQNLHADQLISARYLALYNSISFFTKKKYTYGIPATAALISYLWWATQKEDIRDIMILYWSVWKVLFSKLHHNILPVDTRGQKYSEHEPFLCMYMKLFHKQWVRNWGTYPRRKDENNDLKCFAFFFYCLTFCCRCPLSYHHQKSPSVSSQRRQN